MVALKTSCFTSYFPSIPTAYKCPSELAQLVTGNTMITAMRLIKFSQSARLFTKPTETLKTVKAEQSVARSRLTVKCELVQGFDKKLF